MSAARVVPGGWFAVRGRGEWRRATLGQVALIWLLPWPMMLVGRVGPASLRYRVERAWAATASRLLGIRVEAHGFDRIHPRQAYVVVALHEGLADPLVLWRLGLPLRFVAREELLTWPVVGALGPGHAAPRRYDPERDGTWDAYDFVVDPAFRDIARALPHRVRRVPRRARVG